MFPYDDSKRVSVFPSVRIPLQICDTVTNLLIGHSLPQIGELCQMDRISFLAMAHATIVMRADVLSFLHSLFTEWNLSPSTIMWYGTAIQWPFEDAFEIELNHRVFSRLGTRFFFPPSPSSCTNNSPVLVDSGQPVNYCSKTPCLTALATRNLYAEFVRFSRKESRLRGGSDTDS